MKNSTKNTSKKFVEAIESTGGYITSGMVYEFISEAPLRGTIDGHKNVEIYTVVDNTGCKRSYQKKHFSRGYCNADGSLWVEPSPEESIHDKIDWESDEEVRLIREVNQYAFTRDLNQDQLHYNCEALEEYCEDESMSAYLAARLQMVSLMQRAMYLQKQSHKLAQEDLQSNPKLRDEFSNCNAVLANIKIELISLISAI